MSMYPFGLATMVAVHGILATMPATAAPAANEQILYAFKGGSDGSNPRGGLINFEGAFFGTTFNGGTGSSGTVYSVTPAGAENVVYSFKAGNDGANPITGVINVGYILYGTTYFGGECTNAPFCGTVYSLNSQTGAEHVLHTFQGGRDGALPASLINVGDTLYGTTQMGGGTGCGGSGCGTVFMVKSKTGVEKVLYSFQGGSDGGAPNGLTYIGGLLYGTTNSGGGIFTVNPKTGAFQVFPPPSGTLALDGDLIRVGGMLYGSSAFGGKCAYYDSGCGTVFSWDTNLTVS